MNLNRFGCAAIIAPLMLIVSNTVQAVPVLSVTNGAGGTPVENSVHGWQFLANRSIFVTHLGLFDQGADGLLADHPIGLFRLSDSTLLTSGTIHRGTGDLLIDGFRYIDTPDVLLSAGGPYVISYYTAEDITDFVITDAFDLSVRPVITMGSARWGTGPFGIPANTSGDHRLGPNFLYVPEPRAFDIAALGTMIFNCFLRRSRVGTMLPCGRLRGYDSSDARSHGLSVGS